MATLKKEMSCIVCLLFSSYLLFGVSEAEKEWTIRLAGGKMACEGRVEVFRHGTWGTISNRDWDTKHAGVVCRQLGCGGEASVTIPSKFGGGDGPVWQVVCTGEERSIDACEASQMAPLDTSYSVASADFWDHDSDAGIRCHVETMDSLNPKGLTRNDYHTMLLTDAVIFAVLLVLLIILIVSGVFAYRRFSHKLTTTSKQSEVKVSHKELPKTPSKEDEKTGVPSLYCKELMVTSPSTSSKIEDKGTKDTEFELKQVRGGKVEEEEGVYITCD
ncbi:hypothetical protein HOLleu_28628 [Holothuria leucospilota]|uniref:SRCR domain-containing protein n=1 Tax=Holothuria leucospilota TaxID=206669 RepID=A0A9Q1BME7_HOLLE|nr:hypothetical protein HOLleu_28628 [Holothuria leucospilota]